MNPTIEKVERRISEVESELALARTANDVNTVVAAERELVNLQLLHKLLEGFKHKELRKLRMELQIVHLEH
jgi:hypothetical protein